MNTTEASDSRATRSVASEPSEAPVRSSDGLGRNPIFVEYYSHEGCNCYKLKLPWPRYAEEKVVLCRESAGFDRAREIAAEILHDYIGVVLKRPNVGSELRAPETKL